EPVRVTSRAGRTPRQTSSSPMPADSERTTHIHLSRRVVGANRRQVGLCSATDRRPCGLTRTSATDRDKHPASQDPTLGKAGGNDDTFSKNPVTSATAARIS